jgi:hypothetical protein
MSEEQTSRKKFLQLLGLTAGATLVSKSGLAKGFDQTEILKLTKEQQEFMHRYEKWMDKFTEVVRIQKTEPEGIEHHKTMIALTEEVAQLQPELDNFMKDETFAVIFRVSIERMTKEI